MSTQLKCMYSLFVKKTFLFQAVQFSQAVLIQLIQLSLSTDFVYTLLNFKAVLYLWIQFKICMQFKCKYGLIVKNMSISSYSV